MRGPDRPGRSSRRNCLRPAGPAASDLHRQPRRLRYFRGGTNACGTPARHLPWRRSASPAYRSCCALPAACRHIKFRAWHRICAGPHHRSRAVRPARWACPAPGSRSRVPARGSSRQAASCFPGRGHCARRAGPACRRCASGWSPHWYRCRRSHRGAARSGSPRPAPDIWIRGRSCAPADAQSPARHRVRAGSPHRRAPGSKPGSAARHCGARRNARRWAFHRTAIRGPPECPRRDRSTDHRY